MQLHAYSQVTKSDFHHQSVYISVEALLQERHLLKQSALKKPLGKGHWAGSFKTPYRGQGADYDQLRLYHAGDDLRHIDWKATARTNQLHTRVYRDEREHVIRLLVDLRVTMYTGSNELQAVRACLLASRLLWHAIENGCRCDLVVISERGLFISEPAKSQQSAIALCSFLARNYQAIYAELNAHPDPTSEANKSTINEDTNDRFIASHTLPQHDPNHSITLDGVATWLDQDTRVNTQIMWVSNFDRLGLEFHLAMETLNTRCSQSAIMISDPLTQSALPVGHYHYQTPLPSSINKEKSGSSSNQVSIDRKSVSQLTSILKQRQKERIDSLQKLLIPIIQTQNRQHVIFELQRLGLLP